MAQAAEELVGPPPGPERPALRVVAAQSVDPPSFQGYGSDDIGGELAAWRRLRSHFERTGDVDEEGWVIVLDIERMLSALATMRLRHDPADAANPEERRRRKALVRDAQQAAEMIAAHMLLGWSAEDSRFPHRARRLQRKVCAFAERYLAGAGFDAADEAFEGA